MAHTNESRVVGLVILGMLGLAAAVWVLFNGSSSEQRPVGRVIETAWHRGASHQWVTDTGIFFMTEQDGVLKPHIADTGTGAITLLRGLADLLSNYPATGPWLVTVHEAQVIVHLRRGANTLRLLSNLDGSSIVEDLFSGPVWGAYGIPRQPIWLEIRGSTHGTVWYLCKAAENDKKL